MRDKRPVDELSVEELERVLRVKRREERMQRFRGDEERRVDAAPPVVPPVPTDAASSLQVAAPAPGPVAPPASAALPTNALVNSPEPRFEDEDELPAHYDYAPEAAPIQRQGRHSGLWGTLLLLLEVLGFVGLLAVLYFAFQGIQRINRNIEKTDAISATSEAALVAQLEQPTATPLVSINVPVLPGGHVWDPVSPSFNMEEVPAAYRNSFAQHVSAPVAQTTLRRPGAPTRIQIPSLSVDSSIRAGDDWQSLQAAVGHHPYSANPGDGNMVLTGHNDIFGEVFRDLPSLAIGDEIRIQDEAGVWYTYTVYDMQVVDPSDVWVLGQDLGEGTPIATLITCYPYRVNTHRQIIFARLTEPNQS